MLRICSGTAKGTFLKSPRGIAVRPTSARVRGAIFSALSSKVPGSRVLDLYAGTGALGIESLSRGAREAVFVELSSRCVLTIKENLQLTGLSQRARIIKGDVLRAVRVLGRQGGKYDLVIADPPYEPRKGARSNLSLAEKTLQALVDSGILASDSLVAVEHSRTEVGLRTPEGLRLLSVRRYGETVVSTFCPVVQR